ncbi:hypothetical protein ACP70R_008525 [Stipagrostis hirtigluma subsp. patula]
MATMFPSAGRKVLFIAAITIALLLFAGQVCPSVAHYDLCREPDPAITNCYTWCQNQGYPKGGDVQLGICCCIL